MANIRIDYACEIDLVKFRGHLKDVIEAEFGGLHQRNRDVREDIIRKVEDEGLDGKSKGWKRKRRVKELLVNRKACMHS